MSSSMRLDVTRCLPSTRRWMDGTSVFECNDDGVVLIVRAQFIQDVRNGHSMLLLKYMHLILQTAQIPAETVVA